ncbi:unnamed protein product [Bubo scandiacus]
MGQQRHGKEQDVSKQTVSTGRKNEGGKSPWHAFSSLLATGFPQDPERRQDIIHCCCYSVFIYFWPGILFMILNNVPVIVHYDTEFRHNGNVKKNLWTSTLPCTEINACRTAQRCQSVRRVSFDQLILEKWASEADFPISESKNPIEYFSF